MKCIKSSKINAIFCQSQKLQKKYDADKEKFAVLQAFVEVEKAEGKTKAKNSATDALLWLKRFVESDVFLNLKFNYCRSVTLNFLLPV